MGKAKDAGEAPRDGRGKGRTTTRGAVALRVDALTTALARFGVGLRRADALEAVAAAFGYRTSNALVAAGEAVAPPAAEGVARIAVRGVPMLVVRGPGPEGELFAVRGARPFATTPGGLLVDLRPAAEAAAGLPFETGSCAPEDMTREAGRVTRPGGAEGRAALELLTSGLEPRGSTESRGRDFVVHVGVVEHRQGTNTYVASTREGLMADLAGYCREWWPEVADRVDCDPATASDADVVEAYFEARDDEGYVEGDHVVGLPAPSMPARERDAVLAGLRLLQGATRDGVEGLDPEIADILMDGGSPAPTADWIDDLCERLNA